MEPYPSEHEGIWRVQCAKCGSVDEGSRFGIERLKESLESRVCNVFSLTVRTDLLVGSALANRGAREAQVLAMWTGRELADQSRTV